MNTGLGRGLGSLIPQKIKKVETAHGKEPVVDVFSEEDRKKIMEIDPEKIMINPMQPRKRFADFDMEELKESIRQYGIIQPLIVSRAGADFELIAGERRLRAAKALEMKIVPAIIRDASQQEKLEVALVENIQRASLNPVETAIAYKKLIDEFNLTQEEVAKRLSKSRSTVANALRLLELPEEIQLALIDGRLTEGHAKVLAGLDNETKQTTLFRKISHANMSVADTMKETRRMGGTKQARIKINYADKDKEFAFREFFGTKVEIKRKGKGGQVIINFYSDEELEEMVNKIKK